MPEVISPSIWYPYGYPGPSFDLNTIVCWTDDPDPQLVDVYFALSETVVVQFNKTLFNAAVAAYSAVAGDSMRTEALWVVGASTYNLEKVACWSDLSDDPTKVALRFTASSEVAVTVDKATFEAAYQLYQDAVIP